MRRATPEDSQPSSPIRWLPLLRGGGEKGRAERDRPAFLRALAALAALAGAALALVLTARPGSAQAPRTGGPDGAEVGRASVDGRHPVTRIQAEVEVDAVLDEPAWDRAAEIRLRWEASPRRNAEAPVETACRFLHDRERLYVGCRASDPDPEAIRAHLADRDTPFDDDWIRLVFDTFGDRRQAFEFRMNPLGVQMDALVTQNGSDFAWDGIWTSDGRVTADGYVVEAAIPFRSMNFPSSEGEQSWGVLVDRSWPRSETHRLRSIRTDYEEQCELCQAERLTGLTPGRAGHGVELDPTLTTSRTDERSGLTAPSLESGPVEVEPGLTGSWRFSPNFQLSGTVNPDFSQVEADAARLETNQRFALSFQEKRPFFLERSDVFRMPSNLIFTRSVVDPAAGVKLTGKEGPNTVGAFLTRDRVNRLIFPGATSSSSTLLEQDVTGFVGRWQRDVGGSSTLSLAVTDREADGYHNRMIASDGNLRLGSSTRLVYLLAGTHTEYPDDVAAAFDQPEGGFAGYFGAVSTVHATREWRLQGTLVDVSPDFRSDAGFFPRTDFRRARYVARRTFWTPDLPWATRFRISSQGQWNVDHDGDLVERTAELAASWEAPLQSRLELTLDWAEERFAGETLSLPQQRLQASIRPSGALEAGLDVTTGEEIDVANARRSDLLRVGPRLEWRAGRHLSLEASHELARLSRDAGGAFLEENVTELRGRWHFSKEAFLRAIVQHRDVSRDPEAFGADTPRSSRGLFGQFLFSYELNPRTALFVGYTDTRRGAEIGDRQFDLRQTGRTFFTKLSYAWRF